MSKIVSFISGKGGTGKTSIVANLGWKLSRSECRVLLVDMDFFTRGLTFYITAGRKHFERGIYEALKWNESLRPSSIAEKLDLLSPTSEILETEPSEDIVHVFSDHKLQYSMMLRKLSEAYDLILVDQQSGTNPLTLCSALLSDGYVIITEEDKTSQRASKLLLDSLDGWRKSPSTVEPRAVLLGFIVNRYTTRFGDDLVQYMERSLFDVPCLAAIPLYPRVRRVFVRDDLMILRHPEHPFSREVQALGVVLAGGALKGPSAAKRARGRRLKGVLMPAVFLACTTAYSALIFWVVRAGTGLRLLDVLLPAIPGVAFVAWYYQYLRRR